MKKGNPFDWLRWIACISGSLSVVLTLFIAIGEFIEGQRRYTGLTQTSFTPIILTIFVIWGIALAGLVLALWKEDLGGIISLVSYILVYPEFIQQGSYNEGKCHYHLPYLLIPSILYLVYWKLNKDELRKVTIFKPENPDKA
jgi:uncharacterized protein (DUF486 family)